MARLSDVLQSNSKEDKKFIGTIAFRSDEITLPDGSTVALGIDCGRWVIVFQREKGSAFVVYEYDSESNELHVDKKLGTTHDYTEMKKIVKYFFSHAHTEELVTILPQGGDNA